MAATVDTTSATIQELIRTRFSILSFINEFSNCILERNFL